MNTTTTNNATTLFCDYYKQWITVYKEGAIRPVTMSKYNMAHASYFTSSNGTNHFVANFSISLSIAA